MHPSVRTFALTLATLAIGGVEGLKFHRRADVTDISSTQGAQNLLTTNAEQTLFYVPMQFGTGTGSVSISGLVSTTRSDIILPSIHAKNLTGFVGQGKSVDEGPIYAGPVSAAGWTVPDQDIAYYEHSTAGVPIEIGGEYAYVGLGTWPNTSTVAHAFGDWSADSFITRILAEPDAGLYWTLLINPFEADKGTDDSFGGVLTIGEIANLSQIFNVSQAELQNNSVPDLNLITGYPWLNNSGTHGDDYYYVIIDAIAWGNGSATLKSAVPGTPSGKIAAYIDSVYPWIQVPYSVTEQMYKGLENSTYVKDTGLWHFKCTELNINITIAGHSYPLSPLTAVEHVEGLNCVGTFQAKPDNAGGDVILGVPFLKNVYARFCYETRRDGEVYDPYAQLMPITNIKDAHNDWETCYAKWGGSPSKSSSIHAGQPTSKPSSLSTPPSHSSLSSPLTPPHTSSPTSSPPHTSSPSSSQSHFSSSSSASNPLATNGISGAVENDGTEEKSDPVKRYLPAIIVGAVLAGLALIGGIIFAVMRKRGGRDGKGTYRGLGKQDDGGPVKAPLYDAEGVSGRYGEGGQGRYTDPYKD